jgi:hypothetical protein
MYVDPDMVANKDSFKLIENNVICPICNGIIIDPVQCLDCENTFCEICIEQWKNKPGNNECPFRCNNPKYKKSRTIKNILSNITFKCQNGCDEIIPYLELEKHYTEKCPKLNIDYKAKYFDIKIKYDDLLKKYNELLKQTKNGNNILRAQRPNNLMTNSFKSKYHPHILKDETNDETDWICDLCQSKHNKTTEGRFRCNACDFDICLKCKVLEESGYNFNNFFFSKTHTHILLDMTFENNNWVCNQCRKKYPKKSIKRFRCKKCDYDICNDCKIKEELMAGFNNMSLK